MSHDDATGIVGIDSILLALLSAAIAAATDTADNCDSDCNVRTYHHYECFFVCLLAAPSTSFGAADCVYRKARCDGLRRFDDNEVRSRLEVAVRRYSVGRSRRILEKYMEMRVLPIMPN
jgi:hypothetical protein